VITHTQKKQPTDGFLKPNNDGLGNSLPYNLLKKITNGAQVPFAPHSYGNMPVFSSGNVVQTKLSINAPGDKYEQEADTIADKVMQLTEEPDGQSKSDKEEKRMQDKVMLTPFSTGIGSVMQTKADAGTPVNPIFNSEIQASQGSGNRMDKTTESSMSNRFGRDFSNIRIHTDADAANMNREINARAFTFGKDIYFNRGEYNPKSATGKHILAHELVHTIQQGNNRDVVQRFAPEDAAEEMIGKAFILAIDINFGGKTYVKGDTVTVKTWDNKNERVTVEAIEKPAMKKVTFTVKKDWLTAVRDKASGLYQYTADVASTQKKYWGIEAKIKAQQTLITQWSAEETKYTTPTGHAEWQRQMDVKKTELADLEYKLNGGGGYTALNLPQRLKKETKKGSGIWVPLTPQSVLVNQKLIQETMYNAFDASIVKWVKYYDGIIGKPKGWPALDPNIVKSMLFQESQMGTSGTYLRPPPYHSYDVMTRFNIPQAVDSCGPQQVLMIKEISPAIDTKYKLDDVEKDMWAAQARMKVLVAKGTSITTTEQTELDELNSRSNSGKRWNDYYFTDPRWIAAVKEFFAQTSNPRNLDYDFWVHTGVRWLYEKRKGTSDWAEAIKAYNGSKAKAEGYKVEVIKRRDDAKAAYGAGKELSPG
jgi:Domain of unknown function (DUF4157)